MPISNPVTDLLDQAARMRAEAIKVYEGSVEARRTLLIRQLLNSGPEKFDLQDVIRSDSPETLPYESTDHLAVESELLNRLDSKSCGTVGCVMGHAQLVHRRITGEIIHGSAAQSTFGITEADVEGSICGSYVSSGHPYRKEYDSLRSAGLSKQESEWLVSILAVASTFEETDYDDNDI